MKTKKTITTFNLFIAIMLVCVIAVLGLMSCTSQIVDDNDNTPKLNDNSGLNDNGNQGDNGGQNDNGDQNDNGGQNNNDDQGGNGSSTKEITMLTQLNAAAASVSEYEEIHSPHDMVHSLEEQGFNFTQVKESLALIGYFLGFDMSKESFVLLPMSVLLEGEEVEAKDIFAFNNDPEQISTLVADGFNIYLLDGYSSDTISVTGVGLDVGCNKNITTINFTGTTEGRDVIIRANETDYLNIGTNEADANVNVALYGSVNNVVAYLGDNRTITYAHGDIDTFALKSGKLVAEEESVIALIEAGEGAQVQEDQGEVIIPTNIGISKVDATVAASVGYTVDGQFFVPNAAKAAKTFYIIYDLTTLKEFRDAVNSGEEINLAKVTADFDISSEEWMPIGVEDHYYHGTFDGKGHTITGLNATTSNVQWANSSTGLGKVYGLFGLVGNGDVTIKNLTLTNIAINLTSDGKNVGALIGYAPAADYAITIENVTIGSETDNSAIAANSHVGGLIGKNYATGTFTIKNCNNYAKVSGIGGYLGGIVGYYATGTTCVMEDCVNYGNIVGPTSNGAAGLIGKAIVTGTITMKYCVNFGEVNNPTTNPGSLTAGIVNVGNQGSAIIQDCANYAAVTSGCSHVAGLAYVECDTKLKGTIVNVGIVSQTQPLEDVGSASGIIYVKNEKTLTVENATIINIGAIIGTRFAGGFAGSVQSVKFAAIGTSTFENIGNIIATYTSGLAVAGGVFGSMTGAVSDYSTIPFEMYVHDCSVTANGNGSDNADSANNMKWTCAGGIVGRISDKGYVFDNVNVTNVSISAVGSGTYNYSGGFVGMIRMLGTQDAVNVLTNATIKSGNTVSGSHKGIVAGCAYESYGADHKNALNYSGEFATGDALGYSWNNGVITDVTENA